MKISDRIFNYLILAIIHFLVIVGSVFIDPDGTDTLLDVLLLILPFDVFYSFFFIKRNWLINILSSVIILTISYLMIQLVYHYDCYPSSDAYGRQTTIVCICLSPVFLWEFVYHINKKIPKRQKV